MNRKIKVGIVDDNSFLIHAIKDKLSVFDDIEVVFEYSIARELLNNLHLHKQTDLILMDIQMPEMDGIELTEKLKSEQPQFKILMLTVFDDDDKIFNAIQAGADGYLLKDISQEELYKAILQTMKGGAAMTPSIALKTLNLLRNPSLMEVKTEEDEVKLSKRETEVLEQLVAGLTYTAIAENLIISPFTVRKHIENIYTKLQVHSKMEAFLEAKKRRLI